MSGTGITKDKRKGETDAEWKARNGGWISKVDMPPDADGKRRQRFRRFASKGAATDDRAEFLASIRSGGYVAPQEMTMAQYLDDWVTVNARRRAPSTVNGYRSKIEHSISPRIGHIKLQALTVPDLDRLYATLAVDGRLDGKGGLSDSSIVQIHRIIHSALAEAFDSDIVARNVAAKAHPPASKAAKAPEMKTWTTSQLETFLRAVAGHPKQAMFIVLALTGMRRAEACGLRWADVDLDANGELGGVLTVRHTIQRIKGEVVLGGTKSGGSRTVDIDAKMVRALRLHRKRQVAERLQSGDRFVDHGLVFARPTGESWSPDGVGQAFDRVVKRAGLERIRLHDLRHTHATLLLAAGVNVKVVSERLGHSSVAFTLDRYVHVQPGQQAQAAADMAALLDY